MNELTYNDFFICSDCGKESFWSDEDCEMYMGEPLCENCFRKKYGYCNICGELNKYQDMNEDIECKGCCKK